MNVEVGFRVVTKCLGYVTYILTVRGTGKRGDNYSDALG